MGVSQSPGVFSDEALPIDDKLCLFLQLQTFLIFLITFLFSQTSPLCLVWIKLLKLTTLPYYFYLFSFSSLGLRFFSSMCSQMLLPMSKQLNSNIAKETS